MRVCYVYFQEHELVYLCAVYPKNAQATLTAEETREYRRLLEAFRIYLRENWNSGWTP